MENCSTRTLDVYKNSYLPDEQNAKEEEKNRIQGQGQFCDSNFLIRTTEAPVRKLDGLNQQRIPPNFLNPKFNQVLTKIWFFKLLKFYHSGHSIKPTDSLAVYISIQGVPEQHVQEDDPLQKNKKPNLLIRGFVLEKIEFEDLKLINLRRDRMEIINRRLNILKIIIFPEYINIYFCIYNVLSITSIIYLNLSFIYKLSQHNLFITNHRPRIPQIRVSNTRLAQAASGCAPSVDVLPIFDVKQQSVRNPARMGGKPAYEVCQTKCTCRFVRPPSTIFKVSHAFLS
ncbi:hypothetical protein WN51_08311 [Melipona quadrifasciata]|uniref:Uncharacterized protein n=1 Tax=Melipona quadrifasciata TaxID=166423 RepID=A0A0M9A9S0_9HYME|nr:hypothetical protein WN51_08311 [Melipona quadrifasciata]